MNCASAEILCTGPDRSYFSRVNPPICIRPADQILGDRKEAVYKFELDRTDRLRFKRHAPFDAQLLSWTGTSPLSIKIDDLIDSGPRRPGRWARIPRVFGTRRLGSTSGEERQAGRIRFPVCAGRADLGRGAETWHPTAYKGSLLITTATCISIASPSTSRNSARYGRCE